MAKYLLATQIDVGDPKKFRIKQILFVTVQEMSINLNELKKKSAGAEQPGCSPAREAGIRKDLWVQKAFGNFRELGIPSAGAFLCSADTQLTQ